MIFQLLKTVSTTVKQLTPILIGNKRYYNPKDTELGRKMSVGTTGIVQPKSFLKYCQI